MTNENAHFKEQLARFGNDTVVRCPKCGRTQYLKFENGLRNGWSICCNGLTMPIIFVLDKQRTIEKAVANVFFSATVKVES